MFATSVSTDPVSDASLVLRCNAARVLAQVLSMPPIDIPASVDLARQAAAAGTGALSASLIALADALAEAEADPDALSLASTRLFVGPFQVAVSPYASWYLEPDQRMMGPVATRAAEAYAEAGLEPGAGVRELPDHIAVELEFVYALGFRMLTSTETIWEQCFQRFWQSQVLPWLGTFVDALEKAAVHPVHRRMSECLRALLAAS